MNQHVNRMPSRRPEQHLRKIKAALELRKWVIQPVDGSQARPYSYAYTIGLIENGGVAELLVTGMPHELAEHILNGLAEFMLANAGLPPSEWDVAVSDDISQALKPVWVTRPSNDVPMHMAVAYYKTRLIPAVQYVWPTLQGQYPWDEQWPEPLVQPVGGSGRPMQ